MPRITLKPNSPDYADRARRSVGQKACDMPGCDAHGEHRAPKDRSLSEYHFFCTAHAQEYNAAWDFFAGMAQQDIEKHRVEALYGERPTWRSDAWRGVEDAVWRAARQARDFHQDANDNAKAEETGNPERDALAVMGFDGPVPFTAIKQRYRDLVKRYHPDTNAGDKAAEELIKRVNMAYTILKMTARVDSATQAAE